MGETRYIVAHSGFTAPARHFIIGRIRMKHHKAVLPVALAGCISMLASSTVPAVELPDHGLARQATVYGDYSGLPAQSDPEFGFSVSMDEGWLAVGAPGVVFNDATHGSNEHGAVFLFQYVDHVWQLDHVILDAAWGDSRCGESVSLDYPYLVVGCPGADEIDNPSTEAGIVRWYSRKIQIPSGNHVWSIDSGYHGSPESRCGTSVVIDAPYNQISQPTLAFGCPGYNDETGLVGVYDRDPDTFDWVLDSFLSADDAAIGSSFGSSISLYREDTTVFDIEYLAVGAPTTTWGSAFGAGTAYVFSGTLGWNQVDSVTHLIPSSNAITLFGESVAIHDEEMLVGIPGMFTSNCPNAPRCGGAYTYEYDPNDSNGHFWDYSGAVSAHNLGGNPPGPQVGMHHGAAVAFGFDNMIAVSAPDTDGFTSSPGVAEEVGMVELYRMPNRTYLGELHPNVSFLDLTQSHFGRSMDFGQQFLAVGEPDSGLFTVGRRGSVHIYQTDRIFANGFEFE